LELFDDLAKRFPAEKYSLIGYSLGGRIVLKLLEIYPEKIDRILLLAPDGIRISLFYRFLTQTLAGQKLMAWVIKNPSFFLTLAGFLKKTGMISEKRYRFALGNFDTEKKRKKVFLVWMTLRKTVSDLAIVKKVIRKYQIPVNLFFGRFDTIIPPSVGRKFQKGMEKNITLTVLESGHRLLREQTLGEVAQKFLKIKNDPGNTGIV
jgi:pimeloyl-ACP methyl ester carboxylesterase